MSLAVIMQSPEGAKWVFETAWGSEEAIVTAFGLDGFVDLDPNGPGVEVESGPYACHRIWAVPQVPLRGSDTFIVYGTAEEPGQSYFLEGTQTAGGILDGLATSEHPLVLPRGLGEAPLVGPYTRGSPFYEGC